MLKRCRAFLLPEKTTKRDQDAIGTFCHPFLLDTRSQTRRMQDLEDRTEQLREREDRENSPFRRNSRPRAYRPTSLNREWYDAVFDKVLSITGEEGTGNSPLERFFADEGLPASQAVCFACTDAGAKALQG